jgi:SynChlorMet cassette protein ScmD
MELGHVPLPNPVVVLREEFDDWAVLYNPDSGEAVGLNPTAVTVWKLLDGRRTVAEITASATREYLEAPPEAAEEVSALLDSFVAGGFVAVPDAC